MGKEVERAKKAIELAQSDRVAIVSGGDAGVYGMAGIVLEVLEHSGAEIPVEVVPGVTAANAGASLVGSPLSGDFAVISLSDLLTPLEVIEKRLDAVFSVGIPVVIYNPRSHGRPHNFALAVEHARKYYPATVPVAVIKNALREGQADPVITTLGEIESVMDADRYAHDRYHRREREQDMEDGKRCQRNHHATRIPAQIRILIRALPPRKPTRSQRLPARSHERWWETRLPKTGCASGARSQWAILRWRSCCGSTQIPSRP